ncbi:hypothetical protein CEUSTIGMA_g2550.t1 [Chlamydomonas eustigma]|uniref:Major facilitator superfamily (MFS) profile domain-containing protein n=1 Tax=Chlamydomonas eustigma TaxID=1157962 RepID=A0A250WWG8_9CHLO|nr:hypothetical protein CEUSTIGMA_g2550.t1 [Chlamydomonas eustigma]|eukprot:GAX75106.1 hypothetical protein CEUSTIGMA_g2550.t1 [Chlamydomonas eustigma]
MGGAVIITEVQSRHELYEGKTTVAVILIATVAACGGLLLGYDNGIMGGITANPDYQAKFFPNIAKHPADVNMFCKYDDHILSLVTSCLYLSAAAAALMGGWTSNKYGRKFTMVCAGVFFGIGTVLVAAAVNVEMLVAGRVVLGFGVGLATQATPLYLTEMAPHNIRGALNVMFQLAVTIGIFAAQGINFGTLNIPDYGWRLSFALGGVPALLLFCGSLLLPDTPNSLVARGKVEEGLAILQRIRGCEDVHSEFEDIQKAVETNRSSKSAYCTILGRRYWPQLSICILLPFFQQFSGINAVMFFSPQMFEAAGQESSEAMMSTVIMGSVNVASTLVAILLVDRLGRRFLFFQGGGQMLCCLAAVAALIHYSALSPNNEQLAATVIAFICIYVAGFAWSWGPLAWLVPSEIATIETRAAGTAIATCTNFLFTFLIGQCFLSMLCSMTWGVFLFFAGFVVLMTAFVGLFVPETKGVPVEEVDALIVTEHWFWSRVVKGAAGSDSSQESFESSQVSASAVASGKATRLSVLVEIDQENKL